MTITDFLLARIAEDEAERNVDLAPWPFTYSHTDKAEAKRWKAECEAKRRIVGMHVPRGDSALERGECAQCGGDAGYGDAWNEDWPCPTLRTLAAIYAEHPDYDEAWRP